MPGWEAFRFPKAGGRLDSFGLYRGPVEQDRELAPQDEQKRGHALTSTTRFEPGDRIYLACRYRGTDIVLSRPLPAGLRQCTAHFDETKPAAADAAITCR